MSLGRLWRTVRWLKPAQVAGRITFRLARPRPDLRPPPPRREARGRWVTPPAREASLVGPTRWRLLGVEHDLAQIGWDEPAVPLLWRYNQHYFDDLNARDSDERRAWQRALVQRWIDDNPPGRGTAWAPYPTSLRIVNWIKWILGGETVRPEWLTSLAVQARWLMRRLEWHLLGNHLFANAKALVFAGLFFGGDEAARWLRAGVEILERELPEQILADGAQFERSPMYHLLALEDVLDLVNIIEVFDAGGAADRLLPALRQRVGPMLHWLACMLHPDGTLARFNDCAEGIAPPAADVRRYAAALGFADLAGPPLPAEGVLRLEPSGYLRAAAGPALLLADVAPVGPDYLPGHAHADTLSFELSLHGQALIVNRGTSIYGEGPRRQLERGTAAHSTVQIGGEDSSEVWAGFRVGRRARPFDVAVEDFDLSAAHDGYTHLPGRPVHRRRWQLEAQALVISDEVTATGKAHATNTTGAPLEALARFHLAPGLSCTREADGSWLVRRGSLALARFRIEAGSASLEDWQHAAAFGHLVPAQTLAVRLVPAPAGSSAPSPRAIVRWSWAATPGESPP